jgi:hypothetical protein
MVNKLSNIFNTINGVDNSIDEIQNSIDFSNFKFKDELNSDFWYKGTFKSGIRHGLINLAEDYFFRSLDIQTPIIDIRLTGSLANYNWSKYSDVDLHIVIDFSKLGDVELYKDLISTKTKEWNDKYGITIKGYDVELYVEDINEVHTSSGVYSLLKNEWVTKPTKNYQEINKPIVVKKYQKILDKFKKLKEQFSDGEYDNVLLGVEKLKKYIKKLRTVGLRRDGEVSPENIMFKLLRRNEILDDINDLYIKSYNSKYTISEDVIIEDYPKDFDIELFSTLRSFSARVKYCEKYLNRISSGSSRIVYKIDETKVLKLAKNNKGLAQNEVEIELSNYSDLEGVVAKVFNYDENNLWLEMELAKKINNNDFKRIIGYNFIDFTKFIYNVAVDANITRNRYKHDLPSEIADAMWEDINITSIVDYMVNYDIPPGDLMRLSSYGAIKRGGNEDIVIIDYGLTKDVYASHYA